MLHSPTPAQQLKRSQLLAAMTAFAALRAAAHLAMCPQRPRRARASAALHSEVVVKGQLRRVLAVVGVEARHDAALLVLAHPLLKKVGLAPAATGSSKGLGFKAHIRKYCAGYCAVAA